MGEQFLAERSGHIAHLRAVPAQDEAPVARNQIHESAESQFDRRKIGVDVRVIEFDVVDDGQLWQVMHELGAFVEICGVVLVAFDDEVIAAGHAKAHAKILGDATYQVCRIQSALIRKPGRDAGRRGFAVRAGNHQRTPPANEFFFDNFRK